MTEQKIRIIKEGYVVITPTLCQGDVLAWATEDDKGEDIPDVFDTIKDAQLEMLDTLEEQIQQFKDGEREWDEIDFNCGDEFIARYVEYEDGSITVYELPDEGTGDQGLLILETTLEEWRKNR